MRKNMRFRLRITVALLLIISIITGCADSSDEVTADNGVVSGTAVAVEGIESAVSEDDGTITEDNDTEDMPIIKINVKKDKFMLPETTMLVGESFNLSHQFAGKKYDVTWTSSDTSIVKAAKSGGRITAKKVGEATVDGISADGKHRFRCEVTVNKKPKSIIYLTFDDGPSRYTTPKILKILKKNNIKATFFELKPDKDNYDLTKKVIAEGHTLAIHGYSHQYSKIYQSDKTYRKNLDSLQTLFYKKFHVWCTLTRFPGGSSNTISRHYSKHIMSRLVKKVHKWGYKYYDWNVSSGDAGDVRTAKMVYEYVKTGLKKGQSNVVLMHDFAGNDKTINALQKVINYGKKHGYAFLAMTPSTEEIKHSVNN